MMLLLLQIGIMCPQIFFVLDIDCNPSCPIILGRPFLRTIGAIIDMKEGNIRFQFPLRKDMEHFPRKKIKLPYESVMRATYGLPTKDGNTYIFPCFLCLARGVKRLCLLGGNTILFLFLAFCSCLVINNLSSLCFFCVFVFNQCFFQVEPLGRLGESLFALAVKNRNFSAHENCCHFYLESDIQLIIFAYD